MIQVINRAFDILEYIAKDPHKPKALGEIAADLKLNAPTCANIIKTMVERKYLEKIDLQKGYILGSMFFEIGGNLGYNKELITIAEKEMESLSKKLNENVILCILNGIKRIMIYQVQSINDLQANTSTEKIAYDTATGRLLLSYLPESNLDRIINKHGIPKGNEWPEIKNVGELRSTLQHIKKQGYATQINAKQIVGIAFPIFNKTEAIAAISVYMPLSRFNELNQEELFVVINKTTKKISSRL